jgi:hypothetical protein
MAGFRSAEECLPIAWIEHDVMNGVPKKMRADEPPLTAARIAAQDECALARADEQSDRAGSWGG